MGRACSTHGGHEKYVRISDGKPEGKRPLGRCTRSWEYNIKIGLKETGGLCDSVHWIQLAQGNVH